jgi:hypothetical protein
MLESEGAIIVTTLHRFGEFPKELRLQIWTSALPGPRIIYVERHLFNKEKDEKNITPQPGDHPEPTYFMSPSPNESITSLLWACKESYEVVTKHYSRIFPYSQTWFCFPKDYLYVDWGSGYWSTGYLPEDFTCTPTREERFDLSTFGRPACSPEIVGQIKNLVMCSDRHYFDEAWLVENLFSVFTGVKVLILADQFHGRHANAEEFVLLEGDLTDELGEGGQLDQQLRTYAGRALISSVPWGRFGEYRQASYMYEPNFRDEWEKRMNGREMPKLFKKSIATRALKKSLLEICGSEKDYWKFNNSRRRQFEGYPQYSDHLSLPQQIAFLELVLGRMGTEYPDDGPGSGLRGSCWQDLLPLFQRLDALVAESVFEELIISEAEEMG